MKTFGELIKERDVAKEQYMNKKKQIEWFIEAVPKNYLASSPKTVNKFKPMLLKHHSSSPFQKSSYASLAKIYGVTSQRIRQIIWRMEEKLNDTEILEIVEDNILKKINKCTDNKNARRASGKTIGEERVDLLLGMNIK